MANYHQIKNAAILTPTGSTDLGSDANRYSNVFMSGNIVMSNGVTVTSTNVITPKVSAITLPGTVTAVAPAGGETITITGTGFNNTGGTPSVLIGSTPASSVTYISSTSLTFTTPALGAGTYVMYVINNDGGTATYVPGLSYSGTPTWSTASGSIASIGTGAAGVSLSVAATGDAPVTYAVKAGSSLPAGLSLNSSTGAITGTAPTVANTTTYNFTLTASDLQNQTTDRAFSIVVVTYVSAVEYLVVAGGGSGAVAYNLGCGGGGAGGYVTNTGYAVNPNSQITVTVGAGGTGVSVGGNNGINSSISGSGLTTITAIGGGTGGFYGPYTNATAGGSGGGASWNGSDQLTYGAGLQPASASGGFGNRGGTGGAYAGGGGGGAGAAGEDRAGVGTTGGAGGVGKVSTIITTTQSTTYSIGHVVGSDVYFAGGGGGGAAGGGTPGSGSSGGGGASAPAGTSGVNGTPGTGGGGGGATYPPGSAYGGNGGKGVVIIRYADSFSAAASTTGSPNISVANGYRTYIFTSSGSITF